MTEPWGLVIIIGPLLLLAVMIFVWVRNRAAGQDRGEGTLGQTNAVLGSDAARPDLESDIARADRGDSPQ